MSIEGWSSDIGGNDTDGVRRTRDARTALSPVGSVAWFTERPTSTRRRVEGRDRGRCADVGRHMAVSGYLAVVAVVFKPAPVAPVNGTATARLTATATAASKPKRLGAPTAAPHRDRHRGRRRVDPREAGPRRSGAHRHRDRDRQGHPARGRCSSSAVTVGRGPGPLDAPALPSLPSRSPRRRDPVPPSSPPGTSPRPRRDRQGAAPRDRRCAARAHRHGARPPVAPGRSTALGAVIVTARARRYILITPPSAAEYLDRPTQSHYHQGPTGPTIS